MAPAEDPHARLAALCETDAIRALLAEYCFAIDERRYADMAALFSEAGTWQTAFGEATGRAAIEQLMRRLMPPFGQGPRAMHSTTNTVVTLEGQRARAVSNWFVLRNTPDGPLCDGGGRYVDALAREGGSWRFEHRRIDRFIGTASRQPPP